MKTVPAPLRTRALGRTRLPVSEIGFGAWGVGRSMWGATDDAQSRRALRTALDAGVNFFDTAYVYGHGHSERLIGELVRESGKRPWIATKIPPKNMQWPAHPRTRLGDAFPADWVRSCTETSLRNLRLDSIDLQQFHVWQDSWLKDPSWGETLAALTRLKQEGKIRFLGVSVNSDDPDTALDAVRSGAVDAVQVIFNLFDQRAAEKLFPLCRAAGVGVIARCPFDEGGLAGTLTPQTRFEAGDFRGHYFGGERLAETCRRAQALERLLIPRHAETLAEAALKFCLSFEEVSTVIPGMRKADHVEANVRSAAGRYFEPALLRELRAHAWIRNFYS